MKITISRGKTTIEREATPEEVQNFAALGYEAAKVTLGSADPSPDDLDDQGEVPAPPVKPRFRRGR